MVRNAEDKARKQIDKLLTAAGWLVCDADKVNLSGSLGVAIREFPLPGHGFADYLLYIAGKAAGVIEAKAEGATLSGVETQSDKYTRGFPKNFPAWNRPLPFSITVDMIATGTDIKPVEIVMFMRAVKSRSFFEQMKGRGVRVIKNDDLRAVTPDAKTKDHFVIVDAFGVCEQRSQRTLH